MIRRGDTVEVPESGRVGTVTCVTGTGTVQVDWREGQPSRSAVPEERLEVRESDVHPDPADAPRRWPV